MGGVAGGCSSPGNGDELGGAYRIGRSLGGFEVAPLHFGRCHAFSIPARVAKRWELNSVLIVNNNNRTTVGLANNTGQQ